MESRKTMRSQPRSLQSPSSHEESAMADRTEDESEHGNDDNKEEKTGEIDGGPASHGEIVVCQKSSMNWNHLGMMIVVILSLMEEACMAKLIGSGGLECLNEWGRDGELLPVTRKDCILFLEGQLVGYMSTF